MALFYLFFLFTFSHLPNFNTPVLSEKANKNLALEKIQLPPGFKIEVFAEGVKNARSLALSPDGTLFVGTRSEGKVYALRDTNADFKADELHIIGQRMAIPNGVAFRNGDLYVAEVSRILKYKNIENQLDNPPTPEVIFDQYPSERHHGWKYIAFGPDNKLYVPVGAPCNICEPQDEKFCSITRLNPDGSGFEIVQQGIRNTVGFTWHPVTKKLWFTDNGRDWMGDDLPACELNYAPRDFMHFGFPYCHQGDVPDPEFGKKRSCADFTPPVQKLGPHVAPLGLKFYTGSQFPEEYKNRIFIAEHGSWNRSIPVGYRITMVTLKGDKPVEYTPFAEGWLQGDTPWGRPVDLVQLPDGSLLVSDDLADVIYRIYYEAELKESDDK